MAQTMKKNPAAYAAQMLDKLRELDQLVHGAYFDMGRILSSISHGKLFDTLGYKSMGHLIEEELSISPSQAYRYLHTYRHFRRLNYSKTEALALMDEHSFTYMSKVLPAMTQKIGTRAVGNAIEKMLANGRQINFQLNEENLAMLITALEKYGAEQREGRLMHSSEALVAMANEALLKS